MSLTSSLQDWYLRRRLAIHQTPLDRFVVRVARTARDYERAFGLLHVAYVFQGFEDVASDRLRITPQHVLPESTVFVAYAGEAFVGTMTVTLDSPAGLPSDQDYPAQMKALRDQGMRLVEFGSLAIVRRAWHSGVARLLEMAASHWSIRVLGATHCVLGANPKALPLYRAIYGFEPFSPVRTYHDLDAPVQGLLLDFARARVHLERHYPKPLSSGRTFAEHVVEGPLPDCVQVPGSVALEDQVRWKLSREVFQELFIAKSDRLYSIDPKTLEQLKRWRTDATLRRPVREAP